MSIFNRARPRGSRPEVPSPIPGGVFPGGSQYGPFELPTLSTQVVQGLPAADFALHMVSNAVASMTPLQAWTPDGYIADTTPNILKRPNANYGVFDFFEMATRSVVMHGNFLGLHCDFDDQGFPNQMHPIPKGMWFAYVDGAGYQVYSILGEAYSREEVFHVRINNTEGFPMGIGVVEKFRRSLGAALDEQNLVADTYTTGKTPSGIVTLTDMPEVDPAQAQTVQDSWVAARAAGGRAPAILPATMKFEQLQWSPLDAQFLESRQWTVGSIAHMFGVQPEDLGAQMGATSMTYANIEQRGQERLTVSIMPYARRFEDEFTDWCLPGGNSAKCVPANLLRSDSRTIAEVEQLEIGNETLTPAEARKRRGLKPIPAPKPAPVAVPDGATAAGAADQLGAATAQPDPIDPNISQTPIKVKI